MGTAPAERHGAIAERWDFSRFQTVADLGGGAGGLLVAILRQFDQLSDILADRPASIEAAAVRMESEA